MRSRNEATGEILTYVQEQAQTHIRASLRMRTHRHLSSPCVLYIASHLSEFEEVGSANASMSDQNSSLLHAQVFK